MLVTARPLAVLSPVIKPGQALPWLSRAADQRGKPKTGLAGRLHFRFTANPAGPNDPAPVPHLAPPSLAEVTILFLPSSQTISILDTLPGRSPRKQPGGSSPPCDTGSPIPAPTWGQALHGALKDLALPCPAPPAPSLQMSPCPGISQLKALLSLEPLWLPPRCQSQRSP